MQDGQAPTKIPVQQTNRQPSIRSLYYPTFNLSICTCKRPIFCTTIALTMTPIEKTIDKSVDESADKTMNEVMEENVEGNRAVEELIDKVIPNTIQQMPAEKMVGKSSDKTNNQ